MRPRSSTSTLLVWITLAHAGVILGSPSGWLIPSAQKAIVFPFAVEEVAYFIPAPNRNTMAFCADGISHPEGDPRITSACAKVIQTNNVEVDDRGLIYSADRAGSGLHIIRLTGRAAQVAGK